VSDRSLEVAGRLFSQAVEVLRDAAGHAASEADLLGVLTLGEGVRRALDQAGVAALADLERRGTFSERGYRSSAAALADLLGWERAEARGHLSAAEHVRPRVGLDGTPLPARLPATAAVFDAGAGSVRHVEVVARVLGSDAAGRLDPQRWMAAEAQLASWIPDCAPHELHARAEQLLEALDADGPEPDEHPEPCVNELRLQRHRSGGGGRLVGRFDDAAMFDAIATLVDAHAAPRTGADDRTPAQRQAEALADACGWVLDHADSTALPSTGGRRPQLNVLVGLADLEQRPAPPAWISAAACPRRRCGCSPVTRRWCRSCWAGPVSRWTSGGPPAPSPRACAARSPPATAAVHAADARPRGAKSTTSCRGSTAERRSWPTWSCSAGSATDWSTTPAGTSTW